MRVRINVLDENQIEKIKYLTEEIIEKKGVKVTHPEALKKARQAGADVNENEGIIKIPKDLLRILLSKVPSSFEARGINGRSFEFGSGSQGVSAIVTDPVIVDYKSGQKRPPCMEDLKRNTIIAQKLDHVVSMSRMDFPVTDYDDKTSSLRALETHLLNHDKHYSVYAGDLENFREWLEIGQILSRGNLKGSRLMSVAVAVVSPLIISDINIELLMGAVQNEFAVIPTICPIAGMTSPYSKEATLLQCNVENIFLAALLQMFCEGASFIHMIGPSASDMQKMRDLYYTFDKVLWKVGGVELAKAYNMPTSAECGGTMTHRFDVQNGAEGMLFMLSAVNSEADLISGLGSCNNAFGHSSEMMILQSEWLKASKFLSKGLKTEKYEEAAESICKNGYGENYIMDDLTIKYLREKEFYNQINDVLDMIGSYEDMPSALENAHKRVEEITADFKSPMPDDIQEEIKKYFYDKYKKII